MHIESFKDLSLVDAMAHEDPILTLLYLHSQETAECARRNLEVTTQLINKHIDLTSSVPRSSRHPHRRRQLASCFTLAYK